MNFDDYQQEARKTAVYPDVGSNFWYPALGLAGEAGEVAERVKKLYRDANGKVDSAFYIQLKKELGDVLWYVANLASEAGMSLGNIADNNLLKLRDRKNRGVLHGDGEER